MTMTQLMFLDRYSSLRARLAVTRIFIPMPGSWARRLRLHDRGSPAQTMRLSAPQPQIARAKIRRDSYRQSGTAAVFLTLRSREDVNCRRHRLMQQQRVV